MGNTAVIPEDTYDSYDSGRTYKYNSVQDCQEACQAHTSCFFFQYNKKERKCWFKNNKALLYIKQNETTNKFKAKQYTSTTDFIFGPKYCNRKLVTL